MSRGQRIAIDVTPFLASSTGVGVYVRELVGALLATSPTDGSERLCLFAFSVRMGARARLSAAFPGGAPEIRVRYAPPRCIAALTDGSAWPDAETLVGPADVCHMSHLWVPAGKRTAVVVTVHDLTPILFPQFHLASNRFTEDQLRRRLDRADLVIVPSQSTANDLAGILGSGGKSLRIIPLGVGGNFKPLARGHRHVLKELGIDGEFLLAVGSLEPRKNLPRLFEAMRLLKDQLRLPHKLVVVGPKGWLNEPIYASVHRLRLESSVIFTGFVDVEILNVLYNEAELLVFPSLYEGFGFPPLEAMAAGCPVAVSRASSLPEVVGGAGAYFDPVDVEDIARAVSDLIASPEVRQKRASAGLERSRKFSWERTAEQTRQAWREAIGIRHAARDRWGRSLRLI